MIGLVVIDMQKWMFRYPERTAQIPSLLVNINTLVEEFERLGLSIFDVQTIHSSDRGSWSHLMLKYNYPCLIDNTDEAKHIEGYYLPPRARHLTKTRNSAFLDTSFESQLRASGISDLLLTGAFIDGCVGLTAADAAQRGFNVIFVDDAIGHTNPDRRSVILNWLAEDYELKVINTKQAVTLVQDLHLQ